MTGQTYATCRCRRVPASFVQRDLKWRVKYTPSAMVAVAGPTHHLLRAYNVELPPTPDFPAFFVFRPGRWFEEAT